MKYKLLSIFGLIFNILLFFIFTVKADDGGEFEAEGLAATLGVAGFVLFGFAIMAGSVIFLNRFIKVRDAFQKVQFPLKFFYKGHHYISLATIVVLVIHLIFVLTGGYGATEDFICVIAYYALFTLGLIAISGFLFRKVQGLKKDVLRGIHLVLMIIIAIFLEIHVTMFD
jgi:hypothetical protein